MKSNFDEFQEVLKSFFEQNGEGSTIETISLHEASKNDSDINDIKCFYNGKEMNVIDMDNIAKKPYRRIRVLEEFQSTLNDVVNTADGFVISKDNKWFFLEFKDSKINGAKDSLRHNIIRKAYGNWYMILDIFFSVNEDKRYVNFDYLNPIKFAKENVTYILICNSAENPNVVTQIRNHKILNQNYTPVFMQKLKEYLFLDAYVYTEIELERDFVKNFQY